MCLINPSDRRATSLISFSRTYWFRQWRRRESCSFNWKGQWISLALINDLSPPPHLLFIVNTEENVKPPKRRVWETLFCCWRQRSVTITRRSKSQQNGTVDTQYQIHQTIGQASGLSSNGQNRYLLPQVRHQDMHRKCMVIDLDETLVHSSFKVSIVISERSLRC